MNVEGRDAEGEKLFDIRNRLNKHGHVVIIIEEQFRVLTFPKKYIRCFIVPRMSLRHTASTFSEPSTQLDAGDADFVYKTF